MADDRRKRRKDVGRRIARARRNAGHRSQASFADALGYSESAVALAESGNQRVGAGLFQAIEEALKMPPMVISNYIESGDEELLDRVAYKSADGHAERPASQPSGGHQGAADDREVIDAVRELVRLHGVDKVTAAVIAAVREYDSEVRGRHERPEDGR